MFSSYSITLPERIRPDVVRFLSSHFYHVRKMQVERPFHPCKIDVQSRVSKEAKWTRAQRINRERSFSRMPERLQMGSGVRGSLDVPTCGPRFVRFALHLPGPDGRD